MEQHTNPWETLDSEIVHENHWYSVRKDTGSNEQAEEGITQHRTASFEEAFSMI